jgi:hypothetical protein
VSDLDAEIVALRVAGKSEREICVRLGCTMRRSISSGRGTRKVATRLSTDGVTS